MSNSPLVTYKHICKHYDKGRQGKKIDKIFVHHMAGNLTVKQCGNVFDNRQASAHYGVNGSEIGLYVNESDTAWHSGVWNYNLRSIGIELANNSGSPKWTVADLTIDTAIKLIADICRRNGIAKLNYTGDISGNLCMHKWVASTSCPGPYLSTKFSYIANQVNILLGKEFPSKYGELEEDGEGGPDTIACTQRFLGTTIDGRISGQDRDMVEYFEAFDLNYVDFDDEESEMVVHLQWLVGAYEDGELGPETVKGVQKLLGVEQDGYWGPVTMKAWQHYLNTHEKAEYPSTHASKTVTAPAPVATQPAAQPVAQPASKPESGYTGELPSTKLVKTNAEVITDTIKFLKWIAGDNNFHYGYTNKHGSDNPKKWNPNAHHNGCYFCKTNTNKGGRSKKGIVDFEHTYCCNPLIGAGWAHGGCVPKAMKLCKKGSSWDYNKGKGYDKSSLFTNLGHPDKSKLKAGDVLCSDNHVALYIGGGKIVEASGGDDNVRGSKKWNNSIHITTLSDSRYKGFKRVHRFNGSVNTTCCIYHGEVGKRVELLQAALKYLGYYTGAVDGLFGDDTLNAVKVFQKKAGITADGIVGPNTITALGKAVK